MISKILLRHERPDTNHSGNLLWPVRPTSEELERLKLCCEQLCKRGYWASFFPEGDGITFSFEAGEFSQERALLDVRECFVPFTIVEEGAELSLADLVDVDRDVVPVKYLMPVESCRLEGSFSIGETKFHAAVDGFDVTLDDHEHGLALCDVSGADVIPNWAPDRDLHAGNVVVLLSYPLIERKVNVPADIYYRGFDNRQGSEAFLRYLIADADLALSMLRWCYCHYKTPEYLPNRPGWIGNFALAYVWPNFGPIDGKLVAAKANVLRISNNWLGLEADVPRDRDMMQMAQILDGKNKSQIAPVVKAAFRAYGQAFYMLDPEASFLSMIYATDALCGVGSLRGLRQRIWVAATASHGNPDRFASILGLFKSMYSLRNKLVHDGETFQNMELDDRKMNEQVSTILCGCISDFLNAGYESHEDHNAEIFRRLSETGFEEVLANDPMASESALTFPLSNDRELRRMQ